MPSGNPYFFGSSTKSASWPTRYIRYIFCGALRENTSDEVVPVVCRFIRWSNISLVMLENHTYATECRRRNRSVRPLSGNRFFHIEEQSYHPAYGKDNQKAVLYF